MKGCRALAAALMALAAWAQGQPLSGVLIDPSGTPVAGVPAVLSSPAGERISQTGPEGAFRFDGLAPGSYRLRILVPGFDPVDQGVRPGGRLVVRLKLAVLKERVTVAGQGAQISTALDSNRDAISVERELLENLPVLDLDYIAALSRFLDPATAAEGGPSLIVDGMEARNAGVTPSAIQEIKINQNPYTVEYPRWSRRRIEVITRTAADRYHGTLNLLFRDHHLNAREAFALLRPPERRRIVEGSLFGPIGRGQKMSFLLSGMRESENLQAVVFARGPEGAIIRNTPTPQQNTYGSLRISRQFGDAQSMFWQVNFQDRWQNNVGVGGTLLPESGLQSRFREDEFLFNHRAVITPALLSQFRILLGRFWAPARSNLAAPKLVVSDAFTGGGAQGDVLRTEVHTSITWLLTRTAGSHTMKFGFNVPDWSRRGLSDRSNQLGTFYFGSLEDFRLGRPFAAVLQQGEPKTVFTEKTLGAFFQDEWQAR
ncbi:MAG: carboxypeptidase regulatory-like domain-containing protein, partial [Acidobacteria bacterium]|nr:carboxypeptidase regulatory-like domain-containing protein [Acidobacteriota bacterium]